MNTNQYNSHIRMRSYTLSGGLLYLLMIILGIIQQVFIKDGIVISGNAEATAERLKSFEWLWRIGVCIEMLIVIITVLITWILYFLTKPVNKNLSLLASLFGLLAIAVQAAYSLHFLEALQTLSNNPSLSVFTQQQLYLISSLNIQAQSEGFAIALLLFGPFFFITGYLIFQSGYFPKVLGVLYFIAGVCYSLSSFLLILFPNWTARYYFFIVGPALIGELSLSLWLLIKGVNVQKWDSYFIDDKEQN
ncbi:MAG: DUF4386 domain-containing protein [Chitinophagaceae bacterium]|nr:DUF4386 domain-containing protein [Chitinophagaceae bacterium]